MLTRRAFPGRLNITAQGPVSAPPPPPPVTVPPPLPTLTCPAQPSPAQPALPHSLASLPWPALSAHSHSTLPCCSLPSPLFKSSPVSYPLPSLPHTVLPTHLSLVSLHSLHRLALTLPLSYLLYITLRPRLSPPPPPLNPPLTHTHTNPFRTSHTITHGS
ncbi:hypothetical protein Pcinc_033165 [Petrolisthes cinctipes]|uniref:Uncharacterized protein n=1 Tax=Petrolisthes cinctipes TaxID=88211 RepID=A0AAE1ESZ0_PETCI|nr:hypothetical protein Pcinc_033165 [Petrolisthes cinctipes]